MHSSPKFFQLYFFTIPGFRLINSPQLPCRRGPQKSGVSFGAFQVGMASDHCSENAGQWKIPEVPE